MRDGWVCHLERAEQQATNALTTAGAVFAAIAGSGLAGLVLGGRLPGHHLDAESRVAVRLAACTAVALAAHNSLHSRGHQVVKKDNTSMSKTSELVERYAVEELKAQIAESNSNPYLGIYGVILGLVVVNAGYINNAFQEVYRFNAWYYTFGYGSAFVLSFLLAIYFVIMQASGTLVKDAHSFELDQEAYRFATEERANLLANTTDPEQLGKIDLQVSENVRHRLIVITHALAAERHR